MLNDLIFKMNQEGFDISEVIPDGKVHRFNVNKSDKKQLGWYICYRNLLQTGEVMFVAIYANWKTGQKETWCSHRELSKEDKKISAQNIKKASEKRDREQKNIWERVSVEAEKQFESFKTEGGCGYLIDKKIPDLFGARIKPGVPEPILAVPARDINGKLWSIQYISSSGKRFKSGGRIQGCFHTIGGDSADIIYICEGFATGATIHMATGATVVCAFMATNLSTVAMEIAKKYYDSTITICADDDWKTDDNPGLEYARSAAEKAACAVIFPRFKSEERNPKDTDYNDLYLKEGLDEVKSQLGIGEKQIKKVDSDNILSLRNFPFPDDEVQANGTIKRRLTVTNLLAIMNKLGVVARYNIMTKNTELMIPKMESMKDNFDNVAFAYLTSFLKTLDYPTSDLGAFIIAIGDRTPYNPPLNWIQSKPWDGISRLEEFYATVTAKEELENPELAELKKILIRKWLISGVAVIASPDGAATEGVLVFQSREQRLGKTKWFTKLCPREMQLTGQSLDPANKDSVKTVISKWLVELGEIDATFRKADIARLKSFLTNQTDSMRLPYGRMNSEFSRRTVFYGSVNDPLFLRDETGNRRFWVVPCEKIDHNHKIDMQQLWAEVYEIYKSGESWYLDDREAKMLNESNLRFTPMSNDDIYQELIELKLNFENPFDYRWLTTTEICEEIGLNMSRSEVIKVGRAIAGMKKIKRKMLNGRPRYHVPIKINSPFINRKE